MRLFGLLLFFVIILQMLDLLNRSSDILEVDGASAAELIRYISLRSPQIASQFAPFAALLAIVLTLAGLSHTSEITIMRAAGMSVHRVLFPFGFVCAIFAVAHFTFHEFVVVPSAEKLDYWEANDYAIDLPPESDTRTDIWINFENQFISASSAARLGDAILLTEVTIRSADENGLSLQDIEARAARYEDGAWRLFGAKVMDFQSLTVTRQENTIWTSSLDPELLFALTIDPDQTSIGELMARIEQLNTDRADTRPAMTSLLSRFSRPMAVLVMPLLGAIAGFGVHRQGVLLARAVTGASLGFTYFVAENMALALGKLGVAPAILGAFFPFTFFMVIGFTIILRMEN